MQSIGKQTADEKENIEQIFFNNTDEKNKMEEKSAVTDLSKNLGISSNNVASLLNSKENIPDEVLFSKPQKEIKPKKSVAFACVDDKEDTTDEDGPRWDFIYK